MAGRIKGLINKMTKNKPVKKAERAAEKPKLEEKVALGKELGTEQKAFLEELMCAIDSYCPHQSTEQWHLVVMSKTYLKCLEIQNYDVSEYNQRLEAVHEKQKKYRKD